MALRSLSTGSMSSSSTFTASAPVTTASVTATVAPVLAPPTKATVTAAPAIMVAPIPVSSPTLTAQPSAPPLSFVATATPVARPVASPATSSGIRVPVSAPQQPAPTPQQPAPIQSTPYPDAPFTPPSNDASQATSNSPILPPPSDAVQWNDPAPIVASQSGPVASNPGIAPLSKALSTSVGTPSLWTRILTFFGFIKKSSATVHGEPMTIEQAAVSIVRRVNNGDQNAMGLMVMIRENAMRGNPTALRTYDLMREYASGAGASHAGEPSKYQPTNMGAEVRYRTDDMRINSGWADAVYLANGPLLRDSKVADVASTFGAEEDANHFIAGVMLPIHPAVSEAHHHGKVVGMARMIQAVRMPNSRISDYSPTVGWELGE